VCYVVVVYRKENGKQKKIHLIDSLLILFVCVFVSENRHTGEWREHDEKKKNLLKQN